MDYLIRRTDGDWFDLNVSEYALVLRPTSLTSEQIEGWGDHRIAVAGTDLAFSFEDSGIQLSFEADIDEQVADKVVEEIRRNIEVATGQSAEVIPL